MRATRSMTTFATPWWQAPASTDRETVEFVIERCPCNRFTGWCELGVPFNREGGDLHLTREGVAQSHRRIVHVNDATGWAVQAALLKAAEANPNITMLPDRSCIDLITGSATRSDTRAAAGSGVPMRWIRPPARSEAYTAQGHYRG
jgi:aspartate oxidase